MGLDMAISQGGNVFLHEKKKKEKEKKTIAVDEILFAGWVKLSQKLLCSKL